MRTPAESTQEPTIKTSLPAVSATVDELFGYFQQTLQQERAALQAACEGMLVQQGAIAHACQTLAACGQGGKGRVVVSGVGKAGLIARKVAATLSSTGTAAIYIHPTEGLHGDVGFVHRGDAAILFSYSGETVELIRLALQLSELGSEIIAVTRNTKSSLAGIASTTIATGDVEEACYLGLAPSSSTTVMLAIGDALALSVAQHNGFREEDFARNHPGGSLGLKFRQVKSAMRTGTRLVLMPPEAAVRAVVQAVSDAKTGAAILVNDDGTLSAIFTDGDLRRALLKGELIMEESVVQFSSHPCHFITSDASLAEAMNLFSQTRTEDLPVVDSADNRVVGLLCLKDVRIQ